MPTVFRFNGIRFHFFANESTPREPVHIHAERSDADAKLWLYPEVTIAKTFGYNRSGSYRPPAARRDREDVE